MQRYAPSGQFTHHISLRNARDGGSLAQSHLFRSKSPDGQMQLGFLRLHLLLQKSW